MRTVRMQFPTLSDPHACAGLSAENKELTKMKELRDHGRLWAKASEGRIVEAPKRTVSVGRLPRTLASGGSRRGEVLSFKHHAEVAALPALIAGRPKGKAALTAARALAWVAGFAALFAVGLLASLLVIVPEPTSYLG